MAVASSTIAAPASLRSDRDRLDGGTSDRDQIGISDRLRRNQHSNRNFAMVGAIGHCYGLAGEIAKAEALLKELEEASAHKYVTPRAPAWILLGLARHKEALGMAREGFSGAVGLGHSCQHSACLRRPARQPAARG
jgi:hypothetical protein